jgi:hypothetical protein
MADSQSALAGIADEEAPDTGTPQAAPAPVVSAPVLAGQIADGANRAADSNPAPNAPGAWARHLMAGVQDALAGFGAEGRVPPGGALGGIGAGAREAQARRQQQFQNQLQTRQMSREEAIARATIAHENVQTLYTGQLMSQLSNENQQKLIETGKQAINSLIAAKTPIVQQDLTEADARKLVAEKKLDPTMQHAYPTGQIEDPTGAKDPSGNPRMLTTWTVMGDTPDMKLGPEDAKIVGYPEGSTMNGRLFNTLYTGAMSAQAARAHMQQLADEANLGQLKASMNLEVQKAEKDWGVSLGKAYGNLLNAQQDFVKRFPDKAGLVPEFAGGVDKWTQLVDQQQRDLQGVATLPKNEQEAAAQVVARKQAYDANPTPSNKMLYDRAVDMETGIKTVVQRERQFSSDLQRQNNEALKGISQENELAKKGIDDINKTWTDPHTGFSGALMQANNTRAAIRAGADGNGLLTSMTPTMEVLGINHAAGISRISPQEAAAAGAPGGWAEKWDAWATKAASGKLTDQLAREGQQLMGQIVQGKFQQSLQSSRLLAANAHLDPATVRVMDINGQLDTLAHRVRQQFLSNPPKTPIPAGKTRVLASDDTFHDVPDVAAAKKIDPNLTVVGVGK